MRYLAGHKLLMRKLQSDQNLPNYEGINIHSRSRNAWDFDETSSYLKYALCQIELDRQAGITERFDQDGEIAEGSMRGLSRNGVKNYSKRARWSRNR